MTKLVFGFLIFFALSLLAACATGLSEIFYLVFLIGILMAFAFASALAGVFVLQTCQTISSLSVIRGNSLNLKVTFKGFKLLPVTASIYFCMPDGKTCICAAFLFGSDKSFDYNHLPCPHRGLWKAGIAKVKFSDVFGFFALPLPRSSMPKMQSVTVYPVLQELTGVPLPPVPSMDYSEINPVVSDQGDSFSDTRLYRDGDSLKRIHWKMTVRTKQLYTRQYEMSIDRMVVILIDTSACPTDSAEAALGYADMATECAAALALYYVNGGHAVRILPSGDPNGGVLIRTPGEFGTAYTLLATVPFNTGSSALEAVSGLMGNLPSISAFHVVAHEPASELIDSLSGTASSQRQISIIYPSKDIAYSADSADSSNTGSPQAADSTDTMRQDMRLIPISQPRDIAERLGGCL